MTTPDIDRWTTTALAPGEEPRVELPDLRTERLGKNVRVSPETKASLAWLGERGGIGPAGVAGRILEELRAQGTLQQTLKASNNRRRKALYRLRNAEDLRADNNRCGCGAECQDNSDRCRYIHVPRTKEERKR